MFQGLFQVLFLSTASLFIPKLTAANEESKFSFVISQTLANFSFNAARNRTNTTFSNTILKIEILAKTFEQNL